MATHANSTNAPESRRGFLRGLVSLPLIGGGLTIVGNPTAAAVPVTEKLLREYNTWLSLEQRRLMQEMYGPGVDFYDVNNAAWFFHNGRRFAESDSANIPESAPPSTRAAAVLAMAGVDLSHGRRWAERQRR